MKESGSGICCRVSGSSWAPPSSEGTLAFVAEAVIDTLPAPAMTTVTWIPLPSIGEAAALDTAEARVAGLVAGANLLRPLEFTRDEDLIELYWRVREGLLGIVGQMRPEGTP